MPCSVEIEKYVNMLCEQCKILDAHNPELITSSIRVWWEQHQIQEEKRCKILIVKMKQYEQLKQELGL